MAKKQTTVRIATVKATGRRYIVNHIDFNAADGQGVVFCWGEVSKIRPKTRRGAQVGWVRTHGETKKFLVDAVEISEAPNTNDLSIQLFEEHVASLRAQGHIITRTRSGNATTHGIDKDHAAKKLAMEMGENWVELTEDDRNALRKLA